MTGINQGRPEMAIGEPIRLGSNNEFEIEQHPVSDRLIIRDTVNGKVAYVRKERGGQIGGDGVLVKALKEGKPVADDGRTHDTIQAAERAASGWVFVPPGDFVENVLIETDSLTITGTGYASKIRGQSSHALDIRADGVTARSLRCRKNNGSDNTIQVTGENVLLESLWADSTGGSAHTVEFSEPDCQISSCVIENADKNAIDIESNGVIVSDCNVITAGNYGVYVAKNDVVVANNIISDIDSYDGIRLFGEDNIVIGNRISDCTGEGISVDNNSVDNILANNRISDSGTTDISDAGNGTILDGNLTGASN